MSNIIIVEGPDGAGKTELVKKLFDAHPKAAVIHYGKPDAKAPQIGWYAGEIQKAVSSGAETIILDRSWYSELVYGPIMRNSCLLSKDDVLILEALMHGFGGCHIIYVTGKHTTLWARCQKRGETYITMPAQLKNIVDKYEEVMTEVATRLPVIKTVMG